MEIETQSQAAGTSGQIDPKLIQTPAPASLVEDTTSEYAVLQTDIVTRWKTANSLDKKAQAIAREELGPKLVAMREMLRSQGRRTDLPGPQGQPAGLTFQQWMDRHKELGSQSTIKRIVRKAAGILPKAKAFKIGDRLQEKKGHATPVCVVTYAHAVQESGSQELDVTFEGGASCQVLGSEMRTFKAHDHEPGEIVVFAGVEFKFESMSDALVPTLTRTTTPTKAEVETAKNQAASDAKAGALPPCGPNPGQVSDKRAAANAKRPKQKVVTLHQVKAEDRAEKKTNVVHTEKKDGKVISEEVILADVLKPAKVKPGPKAKKVAPSPDSEPRKGFEVEAGLICDPDLYPDTPGHYGPNPDAVKPDAHREKLIAAQGATVNVVEPMTTEDAAIL
jgi:hypothetical protein